MKRSLLLLTLITLLAFTAGAARADLVAEYLFDADTSDTSGGGHTGILGGGAAVSGGALVLDGGGFMDLPASFAAVNPFDGSGSFTVDMDFKATTRCLLLSSARDAEPDHHSMSVYVTHIESEGEVIYDNFWVGAAGAGGEGDNIPVSGQWRSLRVTYDAGEELVEVHLLDGEDWSWEGGFNPEIPDIALDTVSIGRSLNEEFPYEEVFDPADWVFSVDNVRIYDNIIREHQVAGGNNVDGEEFEGDAEGQTGDPVEGVRSVRVAQAGPPNEYLSLREIEAYNTAEVNVALAANGGVAAGSSLWPGGIHPFENLNDGVTDDDSHLAIAHTGDPPLEEEWLEVRFDHLEALTSVHLYNRGDCCGDQAEDVYLELYGDWIADLLLKSIHVTELGPETMDDLLVDVRDNIRGGTVTTWLDPETTYIFELDADAVISDEIVVPSLDIGRVQRILEVAGGLEVVLLEGDLAAGQTYRLLSAEVIEGEFDGVNLPPLAKGGLTWDTGDLYIGGTISVVPEPTTIGLLIAGVLALLPWRRRMC